MQKQKKSNLRSKKGITLIALIITVIVILLLAGISISMLAGNNSVLNRAGSSRSANALGAAKDEVNLKVSAAVEKYFLETYNSNTAAAAGSKYSKSTLDQRAMDSVTSIETPDVSIRLQDSDKWNENQQIILRYDPDGSCVMGTLENGVMTWGAITPNGQDPIDPGKNSYAHAYGHLAESEDAEKYLFEYGDITTAKVDGTKEIAKIADNSGELRIAGTDDTESVGTVKITGIDEDWLKRYYKANHESDVVTHYAGTDGSTGQYEGGSYMVSFSDLDELYSKYSSYISDSYDRRTESTGVEGITESGNYYRDSSGSLTYLSDWSSCRNFFHRHADDFTSNSDSSIAGSIIDYGEKKTSDGEYHWYIYDIDSDGKSVYFSEDKEIYSCTEQEYEAFENGELQNEIESRLDNFDHDYYKEIGIGMFPDYYVDRIYENLEYLEAYVPSTRRAGFTVERFSAGSIYQYSADPSFLEKLVIPEKVTLSYDSGKGCYLYDPNGQQYDVVGADLSGLMPYVGDKVDELYIPDTVRELKFADGSGGNSIYLNVLRLPGGLKTINSNFKSTYFPFGVGSINTIILGKGITDVQANAFKNMGVSNLYLPKTLKSLGNDSGISHVYFESNQAKWDTVTGNKPSNVTLNKTYE